MFTALYYIALVYDTVLKIPYLGRFLDIFSGVMVMMLRCFSGNFVAKGVESCKRPKEPLKIYEFEGCPYCRKVRETVSVLDLDVMFYPCPRETLKAPRVCETSRFRPEVSKQGGKLSFPFLVDPNTGAKMNESDDINEYLWTTYGDKAEKPMTYKMGQWLDRTPLFMLPMMCRPLLSQGILRVGSKAPETPLELWGCEGSPFVKMVREALTVLELPYLLKTVAKGSTKKRLEFRERFGSKLSWARKADPGGITMVQMPFLIDPNTGVEMLESADIVNYLYETYQTGPAPLESWLDYGRGDTSKNINTNSKQD